MLDLALATDISTKSIHKSQLLYIYIYFLANVCVYIQIWSFQGYRVIFHEQAGQRLAPKLDGTPRHQHRFSPNIHEASQNPGTQTVPQDSWLMDANFVNMDQYGTVYNLNKFGYISMSDLGFANLRIPQNQTYSLQISLIGFSIIEIGLNKPSRL